MEEDDDDDIIQSDTTLYFIKLYQIIIPACFGPIFMVVYRLIFRQAECTIDNAFNLSYILLQELIKII